MAFFGVVGMGYDAMIAAYAQRVVRTGVEGYSTLLAFSGVGATAGALVIATLSGVRRKERLTIAGLVLFSGFLALAAIWPIIAAPSWTSAVRLSAASFCLFGAGFGAVLFYSSSMMVIQLAVPDRLRGRIMGIWMIGFSGSVPLGALWTGRAAQSWGVAPVMGVSAALCMTAALIVWASGILTPPEMHPPPNSRDPGGD